MSTRGDGCCWCPLAPNPSDHFFSTQKKNISKPVNIARHRNKKSILPLFLLHRKLLFDNSFQKKFIYNLIFFFLFMISRESGDDEKQDGGDMWYGIIRGGYFILESRFTSGLLPVHFSFASHLLCLYFPFTFRSLPVGFLFTFR